jgi:hypothetical protein
MDHHHHHLLQLDLIIQEILVVVVQLTIEKKNIFFNMKLIFNRILLDKDLVE